MDILTLDYSWDKISTGITIVFLLRREIAKTQKLLAKQVISICLILRAVVVVIKFMVLVDL